MERRDEQKEEKREVEKEREKDRFALSSPNPADRISNSLRNID